MTRIPTPTETRPVPEEKARPDGKVQFGNIPKGTTCIHPKWGEVEKTDFKQAKSVDTSVRYPISLNDLVTPV